MPAHTHPTASASAPLRLPQLIATLILLLTLTACTTSRRQANLDAAAYPPDFALVCTVTAPDDPHTDPAADPPPLLPRYRPAQHLLEPDRLLRVALGPGTHRGLYPPPTARLQPAQVAELYRLTARLKTSNPNPPHASPPDPAGINCRLSFTANGTTTELRGDPQQWPELDALLQQLVQLRGGK